MPLHHLYEAGQYAEAADQGRELIEAHPEYAGRSTTSLLREPPGETPRSLAAEDSDFDPIRAETAFKELVQGNAGEPTAG